MREMVCFLVDSLSSLGFSNVKSLTHFSIMLTHCVLNWQTQSILNVLYNFCLSYLTRLPHSLVLPVLRISSYF